jgi:zinc transport system ATP-binding protein
VSQAAANIPSNIRLTVRELVQLGTLTAGNIFWRFTAEQNERVNRAIEMAGLEEVQDTNIFHLSGGQRQRAVIARVLASKAEFILLDEPLVGIDRESRNSLLQFLDKLCHESQKTILMISHDIAAIQQASHRMIFLEERIRYDGESSCFPDLADLASLRGIQSVHETNYSEDKLYQISSIEDKK